MQALQKALDSFGRDIAGRKLLEVFEDFGITIFELAVRLLAAIFPPVLRKLREEGFFEATIWKIPSFGDLGLSLSQPLGSQLGVSLASAFLALNSLRPSTLYAVFVSSLGNPDRPEIFRSTDSGASWTLLSDSPVGAYAVVCDPANPDTLYAAVSTVFVSAVDYFDEPTSIYKSIDGGATWTGLKSPSVAPSPYALAASSTALFAATPNGVFRSTDGGGSWSATAFSIRTGNIAIDPSQPQVIYASAGGDDLPE